MTKEEFIAFYCEGSGITPEQLKDYELTPVECDCGEPDCKGWEMASYEYLRITVDCD